MRPAEPWTEAKWRVAEETEADRSVPPARHVGQAVFSRASQVVRLNRKSDELEVTVEEKEVELEKT